MPTKAKPKSETKATKPVKAVKATETTKAKPKAEPKVEAKPKPKAEVAPKPKPKAVPAPPKPEYGKKYIFTSNGGEFIGTLSQGDPFDKMTIYTVANGVVTDRTIDIPDVSAYTWVDDKAEIAQRLG